MVLAVLLGAPGAADAQDDKGELRIAVIDMQRILSRSTVVAGLTERIEEQRAHFRNALREQEEAFRESDRALAQDRATLDPTTFAERRQALQTKAGQLQREFDDRKRELDRLFRQGMAQVQEQLTTILQEISSERGLDLVLGKATVVLVSPDLEITEQVLARLNERMKEVDLPGL